MSEFRKNKVKEVDLDLLEQVAKELGYNTGRNMAVRGYGRNLFNDNAELVVDCGGGYDVGFVKSGDDVSLVHDTHMGYTTKALSRILPVYKERLIEQHAPEKGWHVAERVEIGDEIILRLRR